MPKTAIDILDPTWVAALQTVVFTLYIFLLSIPLLFFQTFLPEDIRQLYNRYNSSSRKKEFWLALLCILVFGNYGIKFALDKIPDDWEYKHIAVAVYYIATLIFFIYFTTFTHNYFSKRVFREENVRKQVVELIVRSAKEVYETDGKLSEEIIDHLSEVAKSFSSGFHRSIVVDEAEKLVTFILNNREHPYDGNRLSMLIDEVLITIIQTESFEEKNTIAVLNICKKIEKSYRGRKDLSTYDADAIVNLLFKISCGSVEVLNLALVVSCIETLNKVPSASNKVYKICKEAFIRRFYSVVTIEIELLKQQVAQSNSDDGAENKENIVAFVSWFYSAGKGEMRKYAQNQFSQLFTDKILTKDDVLNVQKTYYNIAEFDTSENIAFFIDDGMNIISGRFS